ncbi:MAG: hypothetical protein E7052_05970 [Lentisphaerae bacterium]|nr:hypothetical protein [Lentisphaerota bacterium]
MKIVCMLLAVAMTAVVSAQEKQVRKPEPRRPKMAQPVYADKNHNAHFSKKRSLENMTPEERQKFNAARKRRFEIMVLINAWKIMPEKERTALHDELIKRIREDFRAVTAAQKERIAKAEADLNKLRQELADREKRQDELVARELDRLLKMPLMPRRGNHTHTPEK